MEEGRVTPAACFFCAFIRRSSSSREASSTCVPIDQELPQRSITLSTPVRGADVRVGSARGRTRGPGFEDRCGWPRRRRVDRTAAPGAHGRRAPRQIPVWSASRGGRKAQSRSGPVRNFAGPHKDLSAHHFATSKPVPVESLFGNPLTKGKTQLGLAARRENGPVQVTHLQQSTTGGAREDRAARTETARPRFRRHSGTDLTARVQRRAASEAGQGAPAGGADDVAPESVTWS